MPDVGRGTCRSCRAPVLWAETPFGRNIPLDPESAEDGNVELVSYAGGTHAVTLPKTELSARRRSGTSLYVSHFATCPNAARHRRRKRADA